MPMCILLIEDNNLAQTDSLLPALETSGYRVYRATTPQTAEECTRSYWPNLILFHPAGNRLLLADFRAAIDQSNLNLPYLVVGSKTHLPPDSENVFLVAPGSAKKLNEAIKKATSAQSNRFIRLPNLVIDCQQFQILHKRTQHSLTPKQFKLLHLFINHSDQVLSRKTIMQQVWETDYMGDTRTLDVHIRWLREKIEENPSRPRRLVTIRGVGYHFVTNIEQAE